MIITCPQCNARFNLHAQVLAPEGRNVRCSTCHEVWYELPDLEELAEEAESGFPPIEDIPEGVKPLAEGANVPLIVEEAPASEVESAKNYGTFGGYLAAAIVFVFIFSGLVVARNTIAHSWPASNAFYQMLGFDAVVPGKGLIFDHVVVKRNNEVLTVEGKIINMMPDAQKVPMIEASLRNMQGNTLERWLIEPPENVIKKEETIAFKADYVPHTKEAHDLLLWFTLKAKTASKGDDNNQAQEADAHAGPSGGEVHGESPAPADAQPHSESSPVIPGIDPHLPPSPHKDVPEDHTASPDHH